MGVEMTTLSGRLKEELPFILQRLLQESPRATYSAMAKRVGISRHTIKSYLERLRKEKILYPPQLRLKMGKNIAEFIYLLAVKDVQEFMPVIESEESIFYYCFLVGPFNLMTVSYKPIDFSYIKGYEKTVLSGMRSDFHVPSIMNHSYETAYKNILEKCQKKIEPSMLDMTLNDLDWSNELWELFPDLKYDLSVDFTPLVKKHGFKSSTFYERVNQLMQLCDMYVPLYPLGEPHYTFFYFLIKTSYQDFIVNCFGELPVFSSHLRVDDYLLSYVPVQHGEEKSFFANTISVWQQRGIIDSYYLSIAYWSEGFTHPGIPFPPPPPPPHGETIPTASGEDGGRKLYMSFM